MHRCLKLLWVVLFSLILGCASSLYANDLDVIKQKGVLRVAVPAVDLYGYIMTRKSPKAGESLYYGMDIDIVNIIAKALNVKVKYLRSERKNNQLEYYLTHNKADIVIGDYSRTWKRQETINFTISYLFPPLVILAPAVYNTKVMNDNIKNFNNTNIRLGVVPNTVFSGFVAYMLPKAQVKNYSSQKALLDALQAKKVDAIVIDQDILRYYYVISPKVSLMYSAHVLDRFHDPIAIGVSYRDNRIWC